MRETINEHSLLYTWKGSRPGLPAVLLSAHLDVVPADPASADQWKHPPFAGEVADGYVWGRGALDVKSQVVALLDAVSTCWWRATGPSAPCTWPSATTRSWAARRAPEPLWRSWRNAVSAWKPCWTKAG